jgi:hypothetical protein
VKRRLITLGSFVLIGVLVSLSVAWTCALWSPMRGSRALTDRQAAELLLRGEGGDGDLRNPQGVVNWGFGWAFVFAVDATIPLPDLTRPATRRPRGRMTNALLPMPGSADDRIIQVVTAGWPLTCVAGEQRRIGATSWRNSVAEPPMVMRQLAVKPKRVLPLRPLWLGMTANTALYAAAVWLAGPGPFVLRRVLRRRRGWCPACGYDLRGKAAGGCPECGWDRET